MSCQLPLRPLADNRTLEYACMAYLNGGSEGCVDVRTGLLLYLIEPDDVEAKAFKNFQGKDREKRPSKHDR